MSQDPALTIESPTTSDGRPAAVKPKRIGLRVYAGTLGTTFLIEACTIVQAILVARVLGPTGRGEYAAVILWPMLFVGIGIFGSNIALSRAAAKFADREPIIRTAFLMAILSSCVTSIACFVALPYLLPPGERHLLTLARVFVLVIPVQHIGLNLMAVDQGAGNFRYFNITRAINYPLYVVMVILLSVCGLTQLHWYVTALLAAYVAATGIRGLVAFRSMRIRGRFYPPAVILRDSIHFGLAGIVEPVYLHVDKAILLWLLDTRALGIYTAALSASAVLNGIARSSGLIAFTKAAQSPTGSGFAQVAKLFRMSLLLWLTSGVCLALLMPYLLPLVYGEAFRGAVLPACLLIGGSGLFQLARLLEHAMRGQGRAFLGLEGRCIGLAAMILFSVAFSHRMGLMAVCLAYNLSQMICLAYLLWRANQHYHVIGLSEHYLPGTADVAEVGRAISRLGRGILTTEVR